jgi:hypothetical protein
MTKMHARHGFSLMLSGFMGVLLAFACIPLFGISSAIPAPHWFVASSQPNTYLESELFMWQAIVVGGVGWGLPMLVGLLLLRATFPEQPLAVAALFIGGVLVGTYILIPLAYFDLPTPFHGRHWWSFGKEASVLLAIAAACLIGWLPRITTRWSGP